jgi:hypothetical protein
MTRLKLAELTSGVGALVLGVGLGALFAAWVGPAAVVVTLPAYSFTHLACGTSTVSRPRHQRTGVRWSWRCTGCWLMLAGILVFLMV